MRFTCSPSPEHYAPVMEVPSPSPPLRPRMSVAVMARWGEHFFAAHIRRMTSKGNYEVWWNGDFCRSIVLPEDIVWSPPPVSLPPPPMAEVATGPGAAAAPSP